MNRLLAAAFALLLSAVPSQLFSEGEATKITIQSLYLKAPIEIVDPLDSVSVQCLDCAGHMVERPRVQCECAGLLIKNARVGHNPSEPDSIPVSRA